MHKNTIYLVSLFFIIATLANAQSALNASKIAEKITVYKNDVRGTYNSIRWFCDNGTIRQPKDPCPDNIGGIQHATYKDDVITLGKNQGIYLGQILAYSSPDEFWDSLNKNSRLKQYQLGKYLARIDNGWVNQKGQYYRGAIQIEDEGAWGVRFYKWLLAKTTILEKDYFLVLQSLKDIPHNGDDSKSQLMRVQSKVISDQFSKFMDLRVKIHSNPEVLDIQKTIAFKKENSTKLSVSLIKKLDELINTMLVFHQPIDIKKINTKLTLIAANTTLASTAKLYTEQNKEGISAAVSVSETAKLLLAIRRGITTLKDSNKRLELLDLVNELADMTFKQANLWKPVTVGEQLNKVSALAMTSVGIGGIELWEWDAVATIFSAEGTKLSLGALTKKMETARNLVEWNSAMVKSIYGETVAVYSAFEPKALTFIDDRIRSSVLLPLGNSVSELATFIAKESSITNKVINLKNQSAMRGLNPGYALGELVVVKGSSEHVEVHTDKIYIFERAPADLKPVSGIGTVNEGNMVSHVQLLARNLGIPNMVLSDENLNDLLAYNGQRVFYAVSNKGNVILKLESDMTSEEKSLFATKTRKNEKIEVPIKNIRLDQKKILNLNNVDAEDSGKSCGPKAANLGQLKALFSDNVVNGFVIPFGIFKLHMDQAMPNQNQSYWQFLKAIFTEADKKRAEGISEMSVEKYQLDQLGTLREAIKKMSLKDEFIASLEKSFIDILGKQMGTTPVFLRSDTNMEDLKDFTGAGLNLTLFNVLEKTKILEGIKDVWASPYTERSFKWRQKYLLNPENVFPSILLIPSVDVDYSGVMITKGITSGNTNDLTVAFSRGAGGAVDGQAAESYLITASGYELLSPAREVNYITLPNTGGTLKKTASFENALLSEKNRSQIRALAETIRKTIPKKTKSDYVGAYDVELGFKNDKLWLFQIRPFVENKKALGSTYLESITPQINTQKDIPLSTKL